MFTIREACPEDAFAIYRLNCDEMGYIYPLNKTLSKLKFLISSPQDKIFVAEADGKIAGYIHANDYDVIYFDHMKNIMGIAVSADFKRQGIGKALLEAVEKWAKDTGACGVRLVSGISRTEAHKFYRACGFSGNKEQLNLKKMF